MNEPDARRMAPAPSLSAMVTAGDSGAEAASASALDSGLTEIALALAMAFFSIMVLAMISLAVPPLPLDGDVAEGQDGLVVAATRPGATAAPAAERALVVLHAGRFYDAGLRPLAPAAITGSAILAIAPSLPLEQAIAARQRLADVSDVIVSTLDERWLARLAAIPSLEDPE